MCGIAGYYSWDEKYQPGMEMAIAWALLEQRGTDAAGAMWKPRDKEDISIIKHAAPSSDLATPVFEHANGIKSAPIQWAAFHTRAKTKGSEENPLNNHPITYGNIMLTHNGSVQNDDAVFKDLGAKRKGEVDTEAIAAALHFKGGSMKEALKILQARMALAWVNEKHPNVLNLYTDKVQPLFISYTPGKFLVYASLPTFLPFALIGEKSFKAEEGKRYKITPNGRIKIEDVGFPKEKTFVHTDYRNRYSPGANNLWDGYDFICWREECVGHNGEFHTHAIATFNAGAHNHAPKWVRKNLDSEKQAALAL